MTPIFSMLLATTMPAMPPRKPIEPVPGYDWMAPKKRKGEPAPAPAPVETVVAEFMKFIKDREAYSPDARSFLAAQREKTTAEGLPEFISLAYSVLSPEFKQGLDWLDADRPKEAADVFEALSDSDDPYLAVLSANFGATALIELDLIDRCQEMLDQVAARHKPIEKYTTASAHFRFMLGYCQVHNLDYELAYGTFEDLLKNHPNAPERLRTTASQILTELSRRAPGQIGDVRDLLTYARRRIHNGSTDERVVTRQSEAVGLLDSLIEEAEQQEQNQNQGKGQGEGRGRGRAQGNKPGGGARESTLPTGGSRVGNPKGTTARPGDAWGKMPPREREQVLQTLQKQFPSQYRELLEQYYKQLSKGDSSP